MSAMSDLLDREAVPFETLHERYGSLLQLVRTMIGVVPNCDPYLEIWPTAFRSYNVMVPNFLNLPFFVWGLGAPRAAMGIGMYVSSRASGCPYCSAHTCSFALRRGAKAEEVAAALEEDARLTPPMRAVARVARSIGGARATVSDADRQELLRHYSAANAEWLVLGMAMMGWLNKTMNALGVPLEMSTVEETAAVMTPSGWNPGEHMEGPFGSTAAPRADSLRTKLGIIPYAPSAIALDKKWTAGVPDRWPAVGQFLREKTGHDFPLLSRMKHRRAIRAIATMIRDNFTETVVGRPHKLFAGLIYAELVEDQALIDGLRAAGAVPVPGSPIEKLAHGLAPSPTTVDETVVESCRALPAAAIVEVVTFVALLQLLHRLHAFYK